MPLTKLQFRPGINREITSYSNEGGWYDCDMVRFRYGVPEKIGGWQQDSSATFLGTCRALHTYVSLAGDVYTGAGTNLKYSPLPDRKSTRLNSSHLKLSRMPSSA